MYCKMGELLMNKRKAKKQYKRGQRESIKQLKKIATFGKSSLYVSVANIKADTSGYYNNAGDYIIPSGKENESLWLNFHTRAGIPIEDTTKRHVHVDMSNG